MPARAMRSLWSMPPHSSHRWPARWAPHSFPRGRSAATAPRGLAGDRSRDRLQRTGRWHFPRFTRYVSRRGFFTDRATTPLALGLRQIGSTIMVSPSAVSSAPRFSWPEGARQAARPDHDGGSPRRRRIWPSAHLRYRRNRIRSEIDGCDLLRANSLFGLVHCVLNAIAFDVRIPEMTEGRPPDQTRFGSPDQARNSVHASHPLLPRVDFPFPP